MSTLLNGVMAMREAGSLLPATTFNSVSVTDCEINALKVDRGLKEIRTNNRGTVVSSEPIVSDPGNLPLNAKRSDWSVNTELYAMFNGDLEAGPLSFLGEDIDSLMVKRTSNRKAYIEWEDVKLIKDIDNVLDLEFGYNFNDNSIESGILYTYGLQPISKNQRGSLYRGMVTTVVYEDIFLVGENGKQLKIKYNPAVSSIKTNIKESRVETIGSKYPFITRNGNVGYKEFPLSGTITHFMDASQEFAPRGELFIEDELAGLVENVDVSELYSTLFDSTNRNDYNNEILEREFRNKVIDFLQDGKPKLFKSPTEGVMIVRLMDVNITPNQQLGRMICDFSCNAVEVDKYSLDNLAKYHIQER